MTEICDPYLPPAIIMFPFPIRGVVEKMNQHLPCSTVQKTAVAEDDLVVVSPTMKEIK